MQNQIKTFEDACKALKLDSKKVLPDFSMFPEKHQKAMIAHAKLVIIAQALNGDWEPNWYDYNEFKYYPWFEMYESSSGSGFSFYDFGVWDSASYVGSRLCFKSRELAEYAGTQFEALYKDYFVIE